MAAPHKLFALRIIQVAQGLTSPPTRDDLRMINWTGESPDPAFVQFFLDLDAVTAIETDISSIMDEGETRIIRRDITLRIEAVLDLETANIGGFLLYPLPGQDTLPTEDNDGFTGRNTAKRYMETITEMLYSDRLLICFGANSIPTPLFTMISAVNDKQYGLLTDSFNGPKTLNVKFTQLPGDTKFLMSWEVKFRTSNNEDKLFTTDTGYPPDINSELRLDIDDEGDLKVIFSGTMYFPNVSQAKHGRRWIDLRIYNAKAGPTQSIQLPDDEDENEIFVKQDTYTQVNGFKKDVSYNIDKTGRAARFNVTYTQLKSNSAFPLGIPDVTFEHTLESTLLGGEGLLATKGFYKWRNSFSGKIRIPNRMSNLYAWFIMHMLVQQKIRRAKLEIKDTSVADAKDPGKESASWLSLVPVPTSVDIGLKIKKYFSGSDAGEKSKKPDQNQETRIIPTRMMMKHNNYRREFTFEFDFLLISPLSAVLVSSCFFDRLNNDYYNKINNPTQQYIPKTLSQQWVDWMESRKSELMFNPVAPTNAGVSSVTPYGDTAGTEIIHTDHFREFLKTRLNDKQYTSLITTVVDPNEFDEAYTKAYLTGASPLYPNYSPTSPPAGSPEDEEEDLEPLSVLTEDPNDFLDEATPINPLKSVASFTVDRSYTDIEPELSWLSYEQEYILEEDNKTFSVEGLAAMKEEDYTNKNAAAKYTGYYNDEGNFVEPTATGFPDMMRLAGTFNPAKQKEHLDEVNNPEKYTRRTYSAGPSRYHLVVKGTAMRARYKIPVPEVITIAGKPAIKVGKSKLFAKTIGAGSDMPVHVLAWYQVYTVDENISINDLQSQIETTGASILYS